MTSVYLTNDFFCPPAWHSGGAISQQQQQHQLQYQQLHQPQHLQQQQQQQQQQQRCHAMSDDSGRLPDDFSPKFDLPGQFEPLDSSELSYSLITSLSPSSTGSSALSPGQLGGGLASAGPYQPMEPYQHQHQQQQLLPPLPAPLLAPPDAEAYQQLGFGDSRDAYRLESVSPPPPPPLQPQLAGADYKAEPYSPTTSDEAAAAAAAGVRRPKPKEDKICGVCGDKALGFNFDAISCESCKAFFRRNASKGVEAFKCPYDANCAMDVSNRRFCKRCRLQKCFDIGMKKEYILTEEEKMEKRKKIDQNKVVRVLESLQWLPKDLSAAELAERELLTETEIEEVKYLVDCYHSSERMRVQERQGQRATNVDDLINFAELSAVRVVDMSKRLAEFRDLTQTDKICLLKGGALELILLRGVISFDPERAQFLDADDDEQQDSMQGQDFLKAAGSDAGYAFFQLAKTLRSTLLCDQTTLIVLLAVCLFSPDRPSLSPEGRDLVEAAQVRYCLLLERLLRTRLPAREARKVYPQLISQLAELRGLEKDFQDLMSLSNTGCVRPLMVEFLDVQEAVQSRHRQQSGAER